MYGILEFRAAITRWLFEKASDSTMANRDCAGGKGRGHEITSATYPDALAAAAAPRSIRCCSIAGAEVDGLPELLIPGCAADVVAAPLSATLWSDAGTSAPKRSLPVEYTPDKQNLSLEAGYKHEYC